MRYLAALAAGCLTILMYIVAGVALMLLVTMCVHAQNAPNCNQQNAILTSATTGPNYNATSVKCVAWTFSYYAEGFSALSIQVEQAPDNNGVPGAFAAVVATGNPATATTFTSFSFNGYAPWIRVNLTSATGTGFVNYTLIGNSYVGTSNAGGGGGGATTSTVNGPDAPGAAPTKNPIQDSGVDGGGLVRRILTDTLGDVLVAGRDAVAASPTVNPVPIAGYNQSTKIAVPTVEGPNGGGFSAMMVGFIEPGTPGDGAGNAACCRSSDNNNNGIPLMINDMGGFDGTNWDRYRTTSLANFPTAETLTARNQIGVREAEKGSRWSVFSNPAVSTQASASIAAEAAVRHVVDCIAFSAANTTAIGAAQLLVVNLRDGATGAGTVIWTYELFLAVGPGQGVPVQHICGLNLAGTTNTAMTLEFSALVTNLVESVSISGYNVN
jgi:hypothetical protein